MEENICSILQVFLLWASHHFVSLHSLVSYITHISQPGMYCSCTDQRPAPINPAQQSSFSQEWCIANENKQRLDLNKIISFQTCNFEFEMLLIHATDLA